MDSTKEIHNTNKENRDRKGNKRKNLHKVLQGLDDKLEDREGQRDVGFTEEQEEEKVKNSIKIVPEIESAVGKGN